MLNDLVTAQKTSPGAHTGNDFVYSVTGSQLSAGSLDKSLPGPTQG